MPRYLNQTTKSGLRVFGFCPAGSTRRGFFQDFPLFPGEDRLDNHRILATKLGRVCLPPIFLAPRSFGLKKQLTIFSKKNSDGSFLHARWPLDVLRMGSLLCHPIQKELGTAQWVRKIFNHCVNCVVGAHHSGAFGIRISWLRVDLFRLI